MIFENRKKTGVLLAEKIKKHELGDNSLLLVLPKGGLQVAESLIEILNLPLDVIVSKKLTAPHNQELAIGAITADGTKYIDWNLINKLQIDEEYLKNEADKKQEETKILEKKYSIFKNKNKYYDYDNLILVDDGVATGSTVLTAVKLLRKRFGNKKKIVLAVPVIAKDTYNDLKEKFDQIIALEIAESFSAVGQFFHDFKQVTSKEAEDIIRKLRKDRNIK